MKRKKIFCVLVWITAAALLSACNGLGVKKAKEDQRELTYWVELNATAKLEIQDLAETPLGREWSEKTGVKLKFIHPESAEQFNLMFASNDLPDIVEKNWITTFPGGPEKALNEKQIIALNDYIDDYAPNLKKYLSENESVSKKCTTNNGDYYMFPFVRGDESLLISSGPIVRKDWLDELGLSVPETMDDWYAMLKSFQSKATGAPLIITGLHAPLYYGMFSGAYGAPKTFFLDDNDDVSFGPMLDGYKECMMELHRWYKEGLLDNNFMSIDSKIIDSSMTNGSAGATYGALGSGIGKWIGASKQEDYDLAAVPYPVLKKGEKSMYSARQNNVNGYGAVITSQCKDVESAMRVLDYCYSEEGHNLMNFGIEGESYTVVDGEPTYTETITNNADGKSMATMLMKYTRAADVGPFVQDKRYMQQYSTLPQQKEAITIWGDTEAESHILPPIALSAENSSEFSKIYNECSAYVDECSTKFVTGSMSFDEWDAYINQLKVFNINRALEIYHNSYQQYKQKRADINE